MSVVQVVAIMLITVAAITATVAYIWLCEETKRYLENDARKNAMEFAEKDKSIKQPKED